MRRISAGELPAIKKELMKKQGNKCPICGQSLLTSPSKDQVVDHCHERGYIRAVLHRGCNGTEGKVRQVLKTWGRSGASELQMIAALRNLASFWENNLSPQTEYIHPKHLTGPQRMALANKEASRKLLRRKP